MTMAGNTVGVPDTPERQQAARVIANANQRYAALRDRTDLSDLGKQAQIANIHLRTKTKLADLQQSEKDRRNAELSDANNVLFGRSGRALSGSDAISARDAADRADAITTPTNASAVLDRAQRSGDQHLASAVAQRAADSGWSNVLDQYVGDDQEKRAALDALRHQNATVGTPADLLTGKMIYGGTTPPEVKGLSSAKLQELADQAGATS
jgi:hypothetical protein